jgi:hypothetical protein
MELKYAHVTVQRDYRPRTGSSPVQGAHRNAATTGRGPRQKDPSGQSAGLQLEPTEQNTVCVAMPMPVWARAKGFRFRLF